MVFCFQGCGRRGQEEPQKPIDPDDFQGAQGYQDCINEPSGWSNGPDPQKTILANSHEVWLQIYRHVCEPHFSLPRWLKKAGIQYHKCYKGPFLTKNHMKKRLQFAKDHIAYDFSKVF